MNPGDEAMAMKARTGINSASEKQLRAAAKAALKKADDSGTSWKKRPARVIENST
jgi:hypothetical protein